MKIMKTLLIFLGAIVLLSAANVCGCGGVCKATASNNHANQLISHPKEVPKTVTLKITGMSCAGCASTIHTALSKTNGSD